MQDPRATEEIDALVARFFSAFDNRSVTPAAAGVVDCFADKAVIARNDSNGTQLYTAGEFAAPRIELLAGGSLRDFNETETESTTQVAGGIATRTSRYVKSGVLDGSPYAGAGTKLFHLVRLDCGWRISSLAWVDDAA
jgi:hypothetical protein